MAANLAALRVVAALDEQDRPATVEEQQVLARWSSWGAVPQIFDEDRGEWSAERAQLRDLLDDAAFAAARRTTINAHYTDPAYVREIWAALRRLGFDGGRVLEPGAGSGTFIGLAPPGADMTGVELDPSTARIARALYPHATIRAESFADTRLPAGHFDAAVGNVPFADVTLHDPRHNRGGHRMHNHFIIKALALTRPSGMVAVLSSRYTLDAANPAARREMNNVADLVGAVRLPTGAHRRAAGTEVVTDLLLFRRREPGAEPASTEWETTEQVGVDGHEIRINRYYRSHPEHVLGDLAVDRGMHSEATLHVRSDVTATPVVLRDALEDITSAAATRGQVFTAPVNIDAAAEPAAVAPAGDELWDGHLTARPDGTFTVVNSGVHEPFAVPRNQSRELAHLLRLRDAAKELLAAEASTIEDTAEIDRLRADLAEDYQRHVRAYGPINRFTLRPTGRVDPQTGQPRHARITPPAVRSLRTDPFAALVIALENFDDTSQTATPATLLSERVVMPRAPVLGAETAEDALAVCLDTHGRVDLEAIADLLGCDQAEGREQLGELVYHDPATDRLVPAAEYLSGNVRAKLEAAQAAAAVDPALAVNVTALQAVIPDDLGMDEIEARLGAAWIDADTHRQFLVELLDDTTIKVEHPGAAIWDVRGNNRSLAATSEWGTERMPAPAIVKAVLEQRPIQVTDDIGEGKRVLNPVETAAAQEKATAIGERFAEWVWEDPDRADRLVAEYNRRFNCLVLRDYTAEGERLTLPGLAATFAPRPHQRAAVARMLSEPAVGLFHQVGAGKTAEMVMGAMELKRLGMVRKPAVVVPNHMLEQFSREWLQLYPQARVLAASAADLAGDKRRAFVARAATNDWDAIIMTRSAFERIPMSLQAQHAYVQQELDALREMLTRSQGEPGSRTIKRLEKMVLAGEERLKQRMDAAKDPGITFEETGVDYLLVDELHDYKNLRTPSNIRDAAIDGSKRATDLHMKTEHLRTRHGERVITGATATPIANSVTEAHVMQRYLRPDLLRDAGVEEFDVWAATFGQTVTEIEMAPTGGGNYRQQTRFARFQNVPEMLRMWHMFGDVKTAEDLQLPTPQLAARPDGQRLPETVVVEPSDEIRAYVEALGERAEQVRMRAVAPEEDNMLKISTDGRKAALDIRMVNDRPAGDGKLDVAADRIAAIWRQHADSVYLDPQSGQPSPIPGALQIVFCDLGTPTENWNAYDELRDQLAARGMPREQVRFIHEARNDVEKARLFAAARSGHVAVLVGSTQKMGVGTNIQARAVALHHLDCPWRPADVEQREGRILRQGNQNAEVGIYRYVVEGSFDAYSWQTVERKARFINQVMRGRLDVREIEDIGDNTLSFAEVKALASGDPLILEKAQADAEFTRLQRLQRAFARNQQSLTRAIDTAQTRIAHAGAALPIIRAAIEELRDTRGDAFAITVAGRHTTSRTQAAALIRDWARANLPRWGSYEPRPLGELGRLAGQTIHAAAQSRGAGKPPSLLLSVRDIPATTVEIPPEQLNGDGIGIVRQIENRAANLPELAGQTEAARAAAAADLAAARDALDRPFKHAGALADAKARSAELRAQMETANIPPQDSAVDTTATAPDVDTELAETRRLAHAGFPTSPQTNGPGTAARHTRERSPSPGRDFDRD